MPTKNKPITSTHFDNRYTDNDQKKIEHYLEKSLPIHSLENNTTIDTITREVERDNLGGKPKRWFCCFS